MGGSDFLPLDCGVGSGVERKRRVCVSVCACDRGSLAVTPCQAAKECLSGRTSQRTERKSWAKKKETRRRRWGRGKGQRATKEDEEEEIEKELAESSFCLPSPPSPHTHTRLSSLPLRPAGSERGKKKRLQSERERGERGRESGAEPRSLFSAELRNSRTFGVVRAHAHAQTRTRSDTHACSW